MKKIICCETPFQVIVALCIKKQFCCDDEVDILIANTFSGATQIASRLRNLKIFKNVIEVKSKDILYSNKISHYLKKIFYIFFPKYLIKNRISKNFDIYDEMFCGNYNIITASIRSYYAFRKHFIKVFMYEEANISYFPIDEVQIARRFFKLLELRNKIFGISHAVRKNIDGLLLFEPNNIIFKPTFPIYKINRDIINQEDFKTIIDKIFNVRNALKNYDKKYIIFEESILANNPNIDDEKVFDKIIEIVGKENVLIKLHPRTSRDRFTEKGIKTLGSDGIPWEALACVGDFHDKVLIAISSSAITTYKTMFGDKMNGYLLFKFLNTGLEKFNTKYDNYWQKMETTINNGGIHMPKTEEEFYELLKKEVKRNEKKA